MAQLITDSMTVQQGKESRTAVERIAAFAVAAESTCRCRGTESSRSWTKSSEYVSQINAIGPLSIEYVEPTDDPRNIAA